ncbi:Light-regulated protein [Acorus gramineus]|uniref:Light-regulated protein n=1 Tax=Acorus gramineus TaxID=55184 RepID=A0AAV9B2Z8_ACOGR|nr:Light-regulated protein [Acorus gramineus]
MQAATFVLQAPLPLTRFQSSPAPRLLAKPNRRVLHTPIRVAEFPESSTVDYSSANSVFPAEACETIGGDACSADTYPEAKLTADASNNKPRVSAEEIDREYVEYNEPKTVFPGEACDDLGGEFCAPEYQEGVFKEKILST